MEQGVPENERIIPLQQDDAAKLAAAMARAARHFPVLQASQKYMDVSALVTAAASIYGPMLYLLWQRQSEQRQRNAAERQTAPASEAFFAL